MYVISKIPSIAETPNNEMKPIAAEMLKFTRYLVEVLRSCAVDGHIVFKPERKQHCFLQPLMNDPLTIDFFRNAELTRIQRRNRFVDGFADCSGRCPGIEVGALFPRLFDDGLEFVHKGPGLCY